MLKTNDGLIRNRIFTVSKFSPHNLLLRRKIINLQWRNQASTTYTVKPQFTVKTHRHCVPPDIMHWKEHIVSLPTLQNLNLIVRKHQTNPNWETSYKVTGFYSSNMSRARRKADARFWIKGRDLTTKHSTWSWTGQKARYCIILTIYKMWTRTVD